MARTERNPGEPDGLAELLRRNAAGLAGAVRAILGPEADAQEILQEAYLRALRARKLGARPREPAAWLFAITMNLARDLRRRRGRRGQVLNLDEVEPMQIQSTEPAPGERMESREALDAARSAICSLPDADKEVFLMRVSGDLRFEAIAEALSIPVGTAKTRMRRALGHLRQGLAAYLPVDGARREAR